MSPKMHSPNVLRIYNLPPYSTEMSGECLFYTHLHRSVNCMFTYIFGISEYQRIERNYQIIFNNCLDWRILYPILSYSSHNIHPNGILVHHQCRLRINMCRSEVRLLPGIRKIAHKERIFLCLYSDTSTLCFRH